MLFEGILSDQEIAATLGLSFDLVFDYAHRTDSDYYNWINTKQIS